MEVPILVRPNTVLPFGAVDSRPDYAYADGVTLRVYALQEGTHVTPVGDTVFVTHRRGDEVRIEAEQPRSNWQVLLAGVHAGVSAEGGTAQPHDHGTLIRAERDVLVITLTGGE